MTQQEHHEQQEQQNSLILMVSHSMPCGYDDALPEGCAFIVRPNKETKKFHLKANELGQYLHPNGFFISSMRSLPIPRIFLLQIDADSEDPTTAPHTILLQVRHPRCDLSSTTPILGYCASKPESNVSLDVTFIEWHKKTVYYTGKHNITPGEVIPIEELPENAYLVQDAKDTRFWYVITILKDN